MFTRTSVTSIGWGKIDDHSIWLLPNHSHCLPSPSGDGQKGEKLCNGHSGHTKWLSEPNPAIIDAEEDLPTSFPFKCEHISTQQRDSQSNIRKEKHLQAV